MQKIKSLKSGLALAVIPMFMAAGSAHAQAGAGAPSAAQGSVTTVDQLIKKENSELLAKIAGGSAAAPGAPAGPAINAAPPPASYRVDSIYGTGANVRADVERNGQIYEGITRGEKMGQCVVVAIADKCVKLAPAKKGAKGCNDMCWTGEPAMPPMGAGPLGGMPGSPLPMGGAPMPQPLRAAPGAAPAMQPLSAR